MSDESMTHRARVIAATERHLARRVPAGTWPVNVQFKHVVMAGSGIACLACGDEGRLPLPRAEDFNAAVESYLEAHRLCSVAERGAP